jgi:hypothetical protein
MVAASFFNVLAMSSIGFWPVHQAGTEPQEQKYFLSNIWIA